VGYQNPVCGNAVGMSRVREVERKFDADANVGLPDLVTVVKAMATVSDPLETQLDATYFDTADLRLARHRVTLRRRTGSEDAGWHLKLPAGADERTEVRLPLGRATRAVPRALADEVRALVRGRPLVPIAKLHTSRVERQVLDRAGNPLVTVAEDAVHAERLTDGAVEVSAWREVEVELAEGDPADLEAVSCALTRAGLKPSRTSSKLARVLGDAAPPPELGAYDQKSHAKRSTAGEVLLAHLGQQTDELITRDRAAREDQPDAVHKMRVATRRLRSALATYRPLLDRAATDPIRDELKWLGQILGRPRDAEVQHQRLTELVAAQPTDIVLGPVRRRIDLEMHNRHSAAHADLIAELDGDRYVRLLDSLDDLLSHPPLTDQADKPAADQLPAFVGKATRRVIRAARSVADAETVAARDHHLHEVRKSAKRARYAAESAIPVSGKPAKRLAKRMEALQELLGEHQDSVTARVLLRDLGVAAHLAGESGFTFGLLHREEGVRADYARGKYEATLHNATTENVLRWTR
jgi:CHAD domain-containing protein